jgi:hypothetical protein
MNKDMLVEPSLAASLEGYGALQNLKNVTEFLNFLLNLKYFMKWTPHSFIPKSFSPNEQWPSVIFLVFPHLLRF